MTYDVMIPGLLPPIEPAAIAEILSGLELPGLRRLLDATVSAHEATDVDTWLCETFGVAAAPDYPMAALARYATAPGMPRHFWLHADPVHISVRRDQLILIGPQALNITDAEMQALLPTLEEQAPSGYEWDLASPSSWFLHGQSATNCATVPLGAVEGRPISRALPHGPDSAQWRRIMTELQMALHNHEVNTIRESQGALPINGVWIWGGGTLPEVARSSYSTVTSIRPLAAGLAKLAGARAAPTPGLFSDYPRSAGNQLLILDQLESAAQYGDWGVWRDGLEQLEAQWLGPMAGAALPTRLFLPAPQRLLVLQPRRSGLWTFWRKPAPAANAVQRLMEYR